MDSENDDDAAGCPPGYNVFELVMSFAVVCGVLWIVAGGLSFWAYINTTKTWVIISAFIYLVGYMIFIGLFGAIMVQISAYNSKYYNYDVCDDVRKKTRRSSDEFMGYSICGFVIIATSITCTFVSAFSL